MRAKSLNQNYQKFKLGNAWRKNLFFIQWNKKINKKNKKTENSSFFVNRNIFPGIMVYLMFHVIFLVLRDVSGSPATTLPPKYIQGDNENMDEAKTFLQENDILSAKYSNLMTLASWDYANNITDENKNKMLDMQQVVAKFQKETWKNVTTYAWKTFSSDPKIYRWFKHLSILGEAALPDDKFKEFNSLIADMENTYSVAKVCPMNDTEGKCNLSLEPELSRIISKSRNYDELKYVWEAWRNVSGKKMKDKYLKYAELFNEAALLNGFHDAGELWRENYESETFTEEIEELWQTLAPLYEQLHAYVRTQLMKAYPEKIKPDGPIPAHLLGNMWAQTWGNIEDLTEPYPGKSPVDVTAVMKKKNMTPLDMFKVSEEFFTSLGLEKMTDEFWNNSVIEKPTDREIVCHASAWDFYDGKDFRIKMCTVVNMEDLITIHHEMGHIQYFQQYVKQPVIFRDGANPGFHEAVGDVLALSVSTPNHLRKIGLLENGTDDEESELNYLLNMALDKIVFLPFAYTVDLWRWNVFNGSIAVDEMNRRWWDMRLKYQGLCPPVKRTEEDFDPAAKYHVASNVPYIRYFVSFVVQFQFHKALCDAAGHEGPLHKCDIYRNKDAGELLSNTLKPGSSIHWREAMKIITKGATNKMDARPLLQYFDPVMKWLKEKNKEVDVGWKSEDSTICP